MANTIISISHPSPFNLGIQGTPRRRTEAVLLVLNFVKALVSGAKKGVALTINAGTSTSALASAGQLVLYTAPSGTQTVTINGVNITAASGANAFAAAANMAAAINASTNPLVQYLVTAINASTSPTTGILSVVALQPGITGNAITIAASGTGALAAGSRLINGVGGSNNPVVVTL